MQNKNYTVLVIAGVVAIIFVAQQYFYLANLLVHNLVDLFAVGRSNVKVYLFLAYTFLLCILALLPMVRSKLEYLKVNAQVLLLSISITFGYGLILLLLFLDNWGLRIRDTILTFNNGELSITMLLHSHLMKGVNALFMNWFHAGVQENADVGFAYIGLLPSYLYWIGMALFVISAVLVILKFIEIYRKQSRWPGLFIIMYSIVSFSLLKNMLDGGILDTEAIIAISTFILILILTNKETLKSKFSYFLSLIPMFCFLLVIFTLKQYHIISLEYFYLTVFSVMAFISVAFTMVYWQLIAKRRTWLGIGLIALSLTLVYKPVSGAVGTYMNSNRIIGSGGGVAVLYKPPQYGTGSREDWKEIEKINNLTIYELHPKRSTKINEVIYANNLIANYLPINFPGMTCNPDNDSHEINFRLVSEKPLANFQTKHEYANISQVQDLGFFNGLHKYAVTVILDPCAPRSLNLVQELLKEQGLSTFFVVNFFEEHNVDPDRKNTITKVLFQ